jgi:hypothetical protein
MIWVSHRPQSRQSWSSSNGSGENRVDATPTPSMSGRGSGFRIAALKCSGATAWGPGRGRAPQVPFRQAPAPAVSRLWRSSHKAAGSAWMALGRSHGVSARRDSGRAEFEALAACVSGWRSLRSRIRGLSREDGETIRAVKFENRSAMDTYNRRKSAATLAEVVRLEHPRLDCRN